MRRILSASVLALALSSMPMALSAQSTTPPEMPGASNSMPDTTAPTAQEGSAAADPSTAAPYTLRPEEQSQMDAWPAEQKSKYAAWPANQQEYFWTLDEGQQKGWWALTDEQRGQVYAMTPEQRAQVWPSITAQVNGQSASAAGTVPAQPMQDKPGSTGIMADAGGAQSAMIDAEPGSEQTAGASAGASTGAEMASNAGTASPKDYPLCSKTIKDSCRNRGGV